MILVSVVHDVRLFHLQKSVWQVLHVSLSKDLSLLSPTLISGNFHLNFPAQYHISFQTKNCLDRS